MTSSQPTATTTGRLRATLGRTEAWIDRHARSAALVLYVVALALRVVHLVAYHDSLLARVFLMDEAYYHAEAWNLVRGVPQVSDSWFMTPIYPYFLSLIFRVTGDTPVAAYAVQTILGALAAPLVFVVSRRFLSNTWAWLTGAATAAFAPLIFFESLFLVEWLVLVAWLGATALVVRRPHAAWHVLVAGALLGVATLGRGSNALLLAPFAVWLFVHARTSRVRHAVWQPVHLLTGWAVVLLPLFVYNSTHAEQPVLLTANAGFNLYLGNGPDANGIFRLPEGLDLSQDPLALRYVQRATGRGVTASEASRFWAHETWDWVREHPGRTLQLFAWKHVLFWNRFAIPQVESFASVAPLFPLGHAPYWRSYWIFPLGLLGIAGVAIRVWRRRGTLQHACGADALVAAGVLTYAISIALFFITDRYRIPAMPHLIMLAALPCRSIVRDLWSGRRPRALGVALLAALALLATHPDLLAIDRARVQRDLLVHDALRFAKAGVFDAAVEAFELALQGAPDDPDLRDGLARMYARAGRDTLAIATFQTLLREDESARSWFNLGNVYRRSKRFEDAVGAYRRALELDPRREAAWNNLGEAYRALGDTAAAAASYQRAIDIVPGHEQALNNLGALRASQGDAVAAETYFRAALNANPRYVPAWTNLAILLSGSQRAREALEAWRMIRTLAPDDARARRALHAAAEAGWIEPETP